MNSTSTTANNLTPKVREQLLGHPEPARLVAILDGASLPGLPGLIERHAVPSCCLLRGELTSELAQAAPYLVMPDPESPFIDWMLDEGWGRHGGIFASSSADLRTLRQHFRSLIMVYDPDLQPLFFRYYDPRVLRTYLPTCNADDLAKVFGPVERYLLESEDANVLLRYELDAGQLLTRRIPLDGS